MLKKTWMTTYFFKQWLTFFYISIPGTFFKKTYMDGHGSHVIIQALEQTVELGLDMVTLISHMSHVL
jgi:hypothetical protein